MSTWYNDLVSGQDISIGGGAFLLIAIVLGLLSALTGAQQAKSASHSFLGIDGYYHDEGSFLGVDLNYHDEGSFLGTDIKYHPKGSFLGIDGHYHDAP